MKSPSICPTCGQLCNGKSYSLHAALDELEAAGEQPVRQPTTDEQAGMNWWNALSELAREYWLKKAGLLSNGSGVENMVVPSTSVADAWAAYKAQPEFTPRPAYRVFDGMRFDGRDLGVMITTGVDGWMGVTVEAGPGITGFSQWCRLGSEDGRALRFGLGGIKLDGNTLKCFTAARSLPLFREGFMLLVEPHMAEQIPQWLPRLAETAVLAQAMATAVERQWPEGKPILHMHSFTSGVAARVVLDELNPEDALQAECAEHWAAKDESFVGIFRSSMLQHLMRTHPSRARKMQ